MVMLVPFRTPMAILKNLSICMLRMAMRDTLADELPIQSGLFRSFPPELVRRSPEMVRLPVPSGTEKIEEPWLSELDVNLVVITAPDSPRIPTRSSARRSAW